MKLTSTALPGVLIIEPDVHADGRGFFLETWNRREFAAAGLDVDFVQDNHSSSSRYVLRGLHYQIDNPQGKLIYVSTGSIFDVAVDLRRSSPTFGKWLGTTLSADNKKMLWIPPGFAHGLLAISEIAESHYKCTDFYNPAAERCIIWNDPALNITWPCNDPAQLLLSAKDQAGVLLKDAEVFP